MKKIISIVTVLVMLLLPMGMINTGATAIDDLTYEILDGEVAVTECNISASGVLEIPAEIDGKPVTSIAAYAFYGCSGLTSIIIPDSVTGIGFEAFYNCTGLTSIEIPDSVDGIGWSAFFGCVNLNSIIIGSGVKNIGTNVFDDTAFYNTEENWDNGVLYIGNYLIRAKESLSGNYAIRSETRLIANSAFYGCSGLTSVIIPDSVTSIGSGAFGLCTSLNSITIPDSVTSISDDTFESCKNLTSIIIPGNVKSLDSRAFENCTSLTSIIIGNGVMQIADETFFNCTGITAITIPDSVTYIGGAAFSYCTELTSVTIGDGVTSIGDGAFYGCDKLTDIYYAGTAEQWTAITRYYWSSSLEDITIHYNAKGIYSVISIDVEGGESVVSDNTIPYGETVTLTATADEGYTFEYWLVNGRCYKNQEIAVMVNCDIIAEPVFRKDTPTADVYTVNFFSYDGRLVTLMKASEINSEDDLPEVPLRYGYIDGSWDFAFGDICADTDVYPNYTVDPTILYQITVDGGTVNMTEANFETRIVVTANDKENFAAWVDKDGYIVSISPVYTFYAARDLKLTAKRKNDIVALDHYINVNPTSLNISTSDDEFRLSIVADSFADAETYAIVERGVIYTTKSLTSESSLVIGADGVKKKVASTTGNGQFMYSLTNAPKDATITARAYMILKDSDGNFTTAYSGLCDASWVA